MYIFFILSLIVSDIAINWLIKSDSRSSVSWNGVVESRLLYTSFVDGCYDRMSGFKVPFEPTDVSRLKQIAVYINQPVDSLSRMSDMGGSLRYKLLNRVIENDIQVVDALIIWHKITEEIKIVHANVTLLKENAGGTYYFTKKSLQSDLDSIIGHTSTRKCSLCIQRTVYVSFMEFVSSVDSLIKSI